MEVAITPNWTDLVQRSSHSGAPDNIDIKYNWFTPDPEEYPSDTPSHDPSVAPDNNNKTLTSFHSGPHVQYIPSRKGSSEVHKRPVSEGF